MPLPGGSDEAAEDRQLPQAERGGDRGAAAGPRHHPGQDAGLGVRTAPTHEAAGARSGARDAGDDVRGHPRHRGARGRAGAGCEAGGGDSGAAGGGAPADGGTAAAVAGVHRGPVAGSVGGTDRGGQGVVPERVDRDRGRGERAGVERTALPEAVARGDDRAEPGRARRYGGNGGDDRRHGCAEGRGGGALAEAVDAEVACVRGGVRIYVVPGPRVAEAAEAFARMLHPEAGQ